MIAETGAVWKITSTGIRNHSAVRASPTATPIETPPTIVMKRPVRSGGRLSA